MKRIAPLFLSLISPALFAQDITFKGAEWDSLAPMVGVMPFYLTVIHPEQAKAVALEIGVYREGELVKTLSSGKFSAMDGGDPLNLKSAIFLKPEAGKGRINLEWNGSGGASFFEFDADHVPLNGGSAYGTFSKKIAIPGKTPVFYIMLRNVKEGEAPGFSAASTPEELLKRNPEAVVLIGRLNVE